jgi:hypothetical protein
LKLRIDTIIVLPTPEESGEAMGRNSKLDHSLLRTLAALIGTLPVALAIGIALAWALPLSVPARYVVGSFGVPLVWVVASCRVFLAASGRRAWLEVLGTLVAAGSVALIASVLRTGVPFWA